MANPTIPCASLYVADLHPDVTEAILYDKFQTHGNVLSIRVYRDLVTRKSLGYARVNYQASSEAKSAMDNLNYEDIYGRPFSIIWGLIDPSVKRSGNGYVFIENLDPSITVKEINDKFSNFGEILSCKVPRNKNGVSKGFAVVNFNFESDAEKAINAINGEIIRDKIVYVAKCNLKTQTNYELTNWQIKNPDLYFFNNSLFDVFKIVSRKDIIVEGNPEGFVSNDEDVEDKTISIINEAMANPIKPCASLYVGDLHPDVKEAILYDKFQIYGNVLSIRVCRDAVTRKSLGYARVNYQDSREAKSAMDNLNYEEIHGRPCLIIWAQIDPSIERSGNGNIFIGNLDPSITVKEINDTFANFGGISFCRLPTNINGFPKGFAVVSYNLESDAEKAIQATNGKIIRDKPVYVAKCILKTQANTNNRSHNNQLDIFKIVSRKDIIAVEGNPECFTSNEEDEDDLQDVEDNPMTKPELRARNEKPRQERSGVNLYIKNLGSDIDDDRLKSEFAQFGNITSAKIMLNKEDNTSRGFGFVCFSAREEAARALSEMNGKVVEGKPLYVALAQKKEDRVAQFRSQFQQRVYHPRPAFSSPIMLRNPIPQRPFMARPADISFQASARRPHVELPRRNIGMPAAMWFAGMPQYQQGRNIFVDPVISQNRNARIDMNREVLGEKIYPLVRRHAGDLAGKITGMFLELNHAELVYMIDNECSLRMKIDEALLVLNAGQIRNRENRHE